MIDSFRGKYYFLSNFSKSNIKYEGLEFQNAEAAFQAMKVIDINDRKQFENLNPSHAKSLGRRVNLRPDWEDIKEDVMYEIVKAKFEQNNKLRTKLLDTGDKVLIEGNTWNDTTWGVCNGVGENKLGKILMRVRSELRR